MLKARKKYTFGDKGQRMDPQIDKVNRRISSYEDCVTVNS